MPHHHTIQISHQENLEKSPKDTGKVSKIGMKWLRWKIAVLMIVVVTLCGLAAHLGSSFQSERTVSWDAPVDNVTKAAISAEDDSDKIRFQHTNRQLPTCLIIGIRKAGTRALLTFLGLHPQIQIASREIHYFDDDENYAKGVTWYRKRMPYSFADQITIEKTPAYFSAIEAPKRVHRLNPNMKMLLIVRDPFDRTVSDYLQLYMNKISKDKPTKPFAELAYDRRTHRVRTDYPPIRRSLYYQYMWNWLQVFDLSQFLIISGDALIEDPLPELQRVENFLGLENRLNSDMFYMNKTRGFYCVRNETMEKCLAESKGRHHPDIDPNVVSSLRHYFAPYNREFYNLVHYNFGWPEQ